LPEDSVGRRAKCPDCGMTFQVPAAAAAAAMTPEILPDPPAVPPRPKTSGLRTGNPARPKPAPAEPLVPVVPVEAVPAQVLDPDLDVAMPVVPLDEESGRPVWPWVVGLLSLLVVGGLAAWLIVLLQSDKRDDAAGGSQANSSDGPKKSADGGPVRPANNIQNQGGQPVAVGFRPWEGHTATIWSVAFSSDGQRAISGSGGFEEKDGKMVLAADNAVRLWDAHTGRPMRVLTGFKDGISCVAFSPDGRHALIGSAGQWKDGKYVPGSDFTVRLWDLDAERE